MTNTVESAQQTAPIAVFALDVLKLFIGAFLGATCAFWFERWKKVKEERGRKINACRRAQFALISRINTLENIYDQQLKQHKDNPNRWAELSPILCPQHHPIIPVDELSFLLDKQAPNLLGELHICNVKFDMCLQTIQLRNSFHEEFQKEFERNQIGPRLQVSLQILTDDLYDHICSTKAHIKEQNIALGQYMKTQFPGCGILALKSKNTLTT